MTLAVEAFNAVTVRMGGDFFLDPDAAEILAEEYGVQGGAKPEDLRLTTASLMGQIVGRSAYEVNAA